MRVILLTASLLLAILVLVNPAHAYVGPGAGITMLGALWAVIAAIVLALAGLLVWPVRRLLRKKKERLAQAAPHSQDLPSETSSEKGE